MKAIDSKPGRGNHGKAKKRKNRFGAPGLFRNGRVTVEVDEESTATAYGGLALFHTLVCRLGLPQEINRDARVFKFPLPYYESDHVLTQAYNLLCGGTAIEDIATLQNSEAVRRILGTEIIPDPTTAGDFLRRFGPQALGGLQGAIDTARRRVWKKIPRKKRKQATITMDSHIREVTGQCKQGADFSYTGKWSYHPLVAMLTETEEWLRVKNRPGNAPSAEGAEKMLRECIELTKPFFKEVYWSGDTAFYDYKLIQVSDELGAHFVVCVSATGNLLKEAEKLPKRAWKPMKWHPEKKRVAEAKQRKKRERTRERIARERGYKRTASKGQDVAEFDYRPARCKKTYRMVVRRVEIEESKGQKVIWEGHRYYFYLTDNRRWSPERVVRFAYKRCDIENDIEQQENGVAAMKMPTGELLANEAFLMMGELAWNLKAWSSLLALPEETKTWEWKRFRHAFVYLGAKVIHQARRVVTKISGAHRYARTLERGMSKIAALAMT